MCQQHAAAAVVGRGGLAEAVPATASADACPGKQAPAAQPLLAPVFAPPSERFDLALQRSDYRAQVEARIRDAKKEIKTDIAPDRAWAQMGLADEPCLTAARAPARAHPQVPVLDGRRLDAGEFAARFERRRTPCVLTHLADDWAAYRDGEWSLERLRARYAEARLKVGEDDEGYPVRLKFKYFCYYLFDRAHQRDDAPMYLFDSTFSEDGKSTAALLDDFRVPHLFSEDLFQHVGEGRRPPYRWLVIGGPRAGTWAHVDPLATAAWNTVISGSKRWCLLPPDTPKALVDPSGEGDEAAVWFSKILPRLRRAADEGEIAPPVELVQHAGETIFVPDGWWHAVINLEPTVAVTQNFCSSENFVRCWRASLHSRPKMAGKWLLRLRGVRPELAAVAEEEAKTVVPKKRKSGKTSGGKDEKRKRSHKHDPDHDRERSDGGGGGRARKRAEGGTAVGGGGAGV